MPTRQGGDGGGEGLGVFANAGIKSKSEVVERDTGERDAAAHYQIVEDESDGAAADRVDNRALAGQEEEKKHGRFGGRPLRVNGMFAIEEEEKSVVESVAGQLEQQHYIE